MSNVASRIFTWTTKKSHLTLSLPSPFITEILTSKSSSFSLQQKTVRNRAEKKSHKNPDVYFHVFIRNFPIKNISWWWESAMNIDFRRLSSQTVNQEKRVSTTEQKEFTNNNEFRWVLSSYLCGGDKKTWREAKKIKTKFRYILLGLSVCDVRWLARWFAMIFLLFLLIANNC